MTLPALDLKLSGFGDIPTPSCTHTQAFPVSSVSWTQAQRGLLFSAFLFGIDTRSYDDSEPLEIIPLRAPKCPQDTWNSPDMDFSNLKISDTHRASRGSGFGLGDADYAVQQHVQSPPLQMENYCAAPFPPMATPTCSDLFLSRKHGTDTLEKSRKSVVLDSCRLLDRSHMVPVRVPSTRAMASIRFKWDCLFEHASLQIATNRFVTRIRVPVMSLSPYPTVSHRAARSELGGSCEFDRFSLARAPAEEEKKDLPKGTLHKNQKGPTGN
ncbi:hypothetical protein FISHEDRAFT_55258 [Fistulina hepatica ATCC 64428]|uniref:Uncharacterized protein n=1 Tax=Fistulina hepatica ATCC 64428 TaxID=1128425 RepID=A0A0D7ARG8_9AGAR|nr:hypothetical protein FISHEDRAFT_55258 [Fistulina hepatica ATCC 64428]